MSRLISVVLHRLVNETPNKFEDIKVSVFEDLVMQLRDRWTLIDNACAVAKDECRYVITFDDGNISDIELALPILKKHGVSAVFFPVTSWIGRPGHLSWNQLRTLKNEGMQIGSHSVTHIPLTALDSDVCREELLRSREIIEAKLGSPITTFAFPFGAKNKTVIEHCTAAGYRFLCTSDHGIANPTSVLFPRNSINRTTSLNDVRTIMASSTITQTLWGVEDVCKAWLKSSLGRANYKAIRTLIKL